MVVFMVVLSLCAADPPAVLGWQPASEGGREYLIQLAPETLDQLRRGAAVRGTMPLPGGGVAAYRITAGSGNVPRRDGEMTTAGRVTADEQIVGESSGRWAAPAADQPTAPGAGGASATAGDRRDVSAAEKGTRRIEDLPDALMPVVRSTEPAAATTGRWGDLPPLDRVGVSERPSGRRRTDQEYRPPDNDPRASVAPLPQESAATPSYSPVDPRPTSGVVPSSATERRDTNMPPLLPLPDTVRAAAKPAERPPATVPATVSQPSPPGGAIPQTGSQPSSAASSVGQAAVPLEAKPWGTLVFVGALLFASLGLNLFLGWTAWEYRRRCESLTITQNR